MRNRHCALTAMNREPGASGATDAGVPRVLWTRAFPGERVRVGEVRRWIAARLPPCEPLDDLLLLAAELCNNAINHTRSGCLGGWFAVQLTWARTFVRVVVTDHGPATPGARFAPAGDREEKAGGDSYDELMGGHGLVLVANLSAAWGIGGDAAGHFVWFDTRWPGLPPLDPAPLEPAPRQLAASDR